MDCAPPTAYTFSNPKKCAVASTRGCGRPSAPGGETRWISSTPERTRRSSSFVREAFFALLLFVLSGFFFFSKNQYMLYAASLAALAFLFCQGRILRASKGIPAWRAPQVVPLILATGLAEGFGLALLFHPGRALLAAFAVLVVARAFAWRHYWGVVRAPSLEPAGRTLLLAGTIGALLLALAAWAAPSLAPLAGLAGLAAAASGWRMKHALVTRAAFKQKFFLPHLPVRGPASTVDSADPAGQGAARPKAAENDRSQCRKVDLPGYRCVLICSRSVSGGGHAATGRPPDACGSAPAREPRPPRAGSVSARLSRLSEALARKPLRSGGFGQLILGVADREYVTHVIGIAAEHDQREQP